MELIPVKTFKEGEVIFEEGDRADNVYIVLSGKVEVTKHGNSVAELHKDSIFGDMAIIDKAPRSATVKALEETDCFVISLDEFEKLMSDAHPIIQTVLKILSGRLRSMTHLISESEESYHFLFDED